MLGYGLTAVAQIIFAIANGWGLILFGKSVAWFGRGIRGPLRDAVLSEAITDKTRGKAFGFHRAADTVGAVIGPLLGVGLLGSVNGVGDLISSSVVGILWTAISPVAGFGFAAILMFIGALMMMFFTDRNKINEVEILKHS
jgi:MFS family permease